MSGASEIKVDCPKCLASLNVPADRGGTRIVCPKCKRSLLVPESQTAGNSLFDDLFDAADSPPETVPPTPEQNPRSSDSNSNPNPTDSIEETREASDAVINESVFDDIDLALKDHKAAGESNPDRPSKAPAPRRKRRNKPQLPPVKSIDEEIELPESANEPLPEIELTPPKEDPLSVSQPAGNEDPELADLDLPDSGLTIEDEFSLDEHLHVDDLDLSPIPTAGEDPFQEDPNKPLSIDGLTPTIKSEDIHGIKCRVCDTRIHVNIDQDGSTIECPDCFSEVVVRIRGTKTTSESDYPSPASTPPQAPVAPAKPGEIGLAQPTDNRPSPAKKKKPHVLDEETLQLAPIVPEEKQEAKAKPPKSTLPKFDAKNFQSDLQALPETDNDPLMLAPLDESPAQPSSLSQGQDLLSPTARPEKRKGQSEEPEKKQAQPKPTQSFDELFDEIDSTAGNLKPDSPKAEKEKDNKTKDMEDDSKQYWEQKVTEVEPEDDETPEIMKADILMPNHVVGWISKNFASPDVIFRTLVAIVAMAISYVMFDIFHNTLNDANLEQGQKMLGTILPAIFGGLVFAVGIVVWFSTAAMVFQNSAAGMATSDEWPGFSPGDWLGPLAMFLFSLWIGSFPGAAFGGLCGFLLEQNTWLVALASMSAFTLAPILYTCAVFNGSAFNIFSTPVFKTIRTDEISWLHYLPYSLAIWLMFFVGTLILFLPTFIFSIVGAAIQVFSLICFASIAGVHAGRMVNKIQKKKR